MDIPFEIREGKLEIDATNFSPLFTIEESGEMMNFVVEKLLIAKDISGIIIRKRREYEYDYSQVKMLIEVANAYEKLKGMKIDVPTHQELKFFNIIEKKLKKISELLEILKKDPITCYKLLKRMKAFVEIEYEKKKLEVLKTFEKVHVLPFLKELKKLQIIQKVLDKVDFIKPFDRSIYRKIFRPIIRPPFMDSKFYLIPPKNSLRIERYEIKDGISVEIYKVEGKVTLLYYLKAPEFTLKEEENEILEEARREIIESRMNEEELKDLETARSRFFEIGKEVIRNIATSKGIYLKESEIEKLAKILVRYTVGFGILELLLADEKITDIYINSPVGSTPIFIQHSEFEECETNLYPSMEEAESWATKFRLYSGRPLDEANPVLDTELKVPGGRARVAAITRTLSPEGLAFAFRRHRDKPWTFPLFIKNRMINPLFAGLISFIVDGGRSILVAGGRGSGKTSLLTSIILEMMKKFRIIVIEDTLEIPVPYFRKLGYNIERLKARSVITRVESELPAEEALRTALRLGDSVLIIGEIRSKEALALFEAMRIGALAHTVAGTIHGESPYGVFDRVVNDLGVPPTSFKATDLIILSANLKTADGLRRFKRVVEVTEVRKHWSKDPIKENAFSQLLVYDAREDELKPTSVLLNGESFVINEIAKRIREFYGNWDLVWDNIMLRAKIKETIVKYAEKYDMPEILEADYVSEANDMFHYFSEEVRRETGTLDSQKIFERWDEWFKRRIGVK